jgi:hypothetical protein
MVLAVGCSERRRVKWTHERSDAGLCQDPEELVLNCLGQSFSCRKGDRNIVSGVFDV